MKANVSEMALRKIFDALEPITRTEVVFTRLGGNVFVELYG